MIKKLAPAALVALPFLAASTVLAQPGQPVATIAVVPPLGVGYSDLGKFVSNILVLAFSIGIIVVLFMLIWGAFEWITSGGDKEAVGKARGRIINALVGLGVLSVAFALAKLAGQFLGFDITRTIPIPGPL